MADVKARVTVLEDGQEHLRRDLHDFQVMAENDIRHPVALLCENLYPTSQGWIKNEKRLASLEDDMKVVKLTVQEHSRQLQEIREG